MIAIEASCTAHRLGGPGIVEQAGRAANAQTLVPLGEAIVEGARVRFQPPLRALDAIHLATAFELGDDVGGFFAYDSNLASAAANAGLDVRSPA